MRFKTLFLILMLTTFFNIHAEVENNSGNDIELYSSQIDKMFTNNEGVFIETNGEWIRVEAIQATYNGFLVLNEGTWMTLDSATKCSTIWTWKCPICGYVNPHGVSKCLNSRNHSK